MQIDIRHRDGLARSGTFLHEGRKVSFPAALDTLRLFPSLQGREHSQVPLIAEPEFAARYHPAGEAFPIALHPEVPPVVPHGACVMVPNWHTALPHPREYVSWLVRLKEAVPPDTLWYAPASALPSTVALLIYTGFELFDHQAVDLCTARGVFCMPEGQFPSDWMSRGACDCPGCQAADLARHNHEALAREIIRVSLYLEQGRLRELLEARCRMDTSQVAILRHLDSAYPFLESRTAIAKESPLIAASGESLQRPEIRRFAERVIDRYRPPVTDVAVLLPCSARKPYSRSRSHHRFRTAIRGRAHELVVTSPLGLVPRELESVYPAAHYDVPVTGYWDREELHWTSSVIARYFQKNRYRRVIAHLEGGALQAAEMAAERCGLELERTCAGSVIQSASLSSLDAALEGERRVPESQGIRGMLSWQFDVDVDTHGMRLRRKGPETFVWQGREQLFSLSPGTGLCVPTFAGWELLGTGYRVHIDTFVPRGDILAPGVLSADERVRERDEVLVVGEGVRATGRAAMGAAEMLSSTRGIAVRVRKVLKE